jgi:hypothetical protein
MKDIWGRLRSPRWPLVLYILTGLVGALVLWWHLGTLIQHVGGWSQPELDARAAANSIHKIIGNPLFLPYKLIQYGLLLLGKQGIFWMRLVSTLFAGLMIIAYYQILRTWYSGRVALMCSFLFLTSAWFLHYARLGTPAILFGTSIGLLWVGIRLRSNASRFLTMTVGGVMMVMMLYIPGYVWIVGALLIWQRKALKQNILKLELPARLLVGGGILLGLAPLVTALIKHPSLARTWLGLPNQFVPSELIYNLWHLPIWLSLQGPKMPVYWLGDVPFLNIFSLVMFILGAFVLLNTLSLDRIRAMLYMMLVGATLTVLNGPTWLFFIAPIVYLFVAAGVALLLQQWFTVFPRNPLARATGILLVTALVAMGAYYNMHHYFVAWPQSPVTRYVFRLRG